MKKTRSARRMQKMLIMVAALTLVLGVAIGSTIAWLTASTSEVTNTFTPSNIQITLNETKPDNKTAKMVPGDTIMKDPYVTVDGDSESCYVYVEIVPAENLATYITYAVRTPDWTELTGVTGAHGGKVYYYQTAVTPSEKKLYILKDNQVTVNTDVTSAQMKAIATENQPTMTFYAYAIQSANIGTQAAAWNTVYGTN